ncbi:iron chaperone [Macrococcoides canis]|uniref:Iron chaperone n=1 Tax=Macrococcoides canis TaxID=1855823 RepID=A0AAE6WYU1_9STAP|nr:DUF1801 domain-containing protein [Macrococcus canis]MCO4096030.1 DUF1801 domain-containing protein [Macrococcus canis]QCT73822.1 iron chaperone [Macrococcus canis]QIH77239.1 iron chaperone [Macrococcus canis]QNR06853.1 iron chaperone [Macrococcus canis]UTH09347.1 DUF1801 domain-containing protein [Macrococcus canis]
MEQFNEYLEGIQDKQKIEKISVLFNFIDTTFPELVRVFKWNTPMYTHHDTFILGISYAKAHISIAPENIAMEKFKNEFDSRGYSSTKGLFRIKWNDEVDYELIEKIIRFNIEDKKDIDTFWRK